MTASAYRPRIGRQQASGARFEVTKKQMRRDLNEQAMRMLSMSLDDFRSKLKAGELDSDDWRVEYLAALIR